MHPPRRISPSGPASATAVLTHRDLLLDPSRRTVTRGQRSLDLGAKEFSVLEALLSGQGTPVSAQKLMERIWEQPTDISIVEATIDRLRAVLGDPPIITSVAEAGYRIERLPILSQPAPARPP